MLMTVMYWAISIPPSSLRSHLSSPSLPCSVLISTCQEKIDELRKLVYAGCGMVTKVICPVLPEEQMDKADKSGDCPAGFIVDYGVELHPGIQVQEQEE
ncbi:hypothetical protein M405DRAFT_307115 [Rhizopogon salebrosus TDB-379]|nr:hypothetical protein M405DRAFT_307115 [Rhizopogon salebrosus TDB-379]